MVTLESERILLRPWRIEDAESAFAIYRDPEVMRFLGGEPVPTLEAQRDWLQSAIERYKTLGPPHGFWEIVEKDSDQIVGSVFIKQLPGFEDMEIGWHLGRDHWGRGYATEAGRLMIAHAFDAVGLERVVAVVNPENLRSIGVTARLGMRWEGLIEAYGQQVGLFSIAKIDTGEPGR